MQRNFYLVDGSGYIFRAFYAVAPLSTSAGFPTNGLFGFTRMLLKLAKQAADAGIVLVFDAARQNFRMDIYPEYKANRTAAPPELVQQLPYFIEIGRALGFPVLQLPGFEADDIIATLTERLSRAGAKVTIVTGDKDLLQLVNNEVRVWDTMRDVRYSPNEVREKFGVGPGELAELLALMGDTSDNIPGLDGVGPKTAVQLVEKFQTVEGLIANVERLKADATIRNRQKIGAQIQSDPERLRVSRKLVEMRTDAPVELEMTEGVFRIDQLSDEKMMEVLATRAPRPDRLEVLTRKLEFESLLNDAEVGSLMRNSAARVDRGFTFTTVWADDFERWSKEFLAQRAYAMDVETTALDVVQAELVGASFSWSPKEGFYIPFTHVPEASGGRAQVSVEQFKKVCGPSLGDPNVKKAGHNLKYDCAVLRQHGIAVEGVEFDTMLAAYVLNPDKRAFSLATVAAEQLGLSSIEYSEVTQGLPSFAHVAIDMATAYAGEDALYAWLLKEKLAPEVERAGLTSAFAEVDMPLVPVLAEMECRGVGLDTRLLAELSAEFGRQLEDYTKQILNMAGVALNLNSPKQLSDLLFGRFGISTKGVKKTKTGYSTDSSVLEKLMGQHPVIDLILEYRKLHKLKSTYVDSLPTQVNPVSGRLHTKLNQTIAATGRLSSSEPNLQNIPIQTPEGRRIREAFVASEGRLLLSADYSQIELRVLAHMSKDKGLISAFEGDVDIHAATAREIFSVPPGGTVTSEQRRVGKTINFGVVYGMGPYRLARDLGISVGMATQYIESYFARFPGVRAFFDEMERRAEKDGEVRTIFGRRRVLADIEQGERDQGFVMRAALNAPIQGSAADLIKVAMAALAKRIRDEHLPLELVLQIHDELLLETPAATVEQMAVLVREVMERAVTLSVPLKVEVGWGENWQAAHG